MLICFIQLIHIVCKYGWNHSLDSKVKNIYLMVCQPVQSMSQLNLLHFHTGVVKCLSFYISFNSMKYCHLFDE